jgi:hypothetical protein
MVSPIHLQGPLSQSAGIRYVGYHVSLNDSDFNFFFTPDLADVIHDVQVGAHILFL